MLKLTGSAAGMLISKYRVVLENMRLKGAVLFLSGCLLVPAPAMAAETVDFPGTPLQNYRGFFDNSLAPSGSDTDKSLSLAGNIINVYNTKVGFAHNPKQIPIFNIRIMVQNKK